MILPVRLNALVPNPAVRTLLLNAGVALGYLLLGMVFRLSVSDVARGAVPALWPAAGVAAVAVILCGARVLPGVILGAVGAWLPLLSSAGLAAPAALAASVPVAGGIALQCWLSRVLLFRFNSAGADIGTARGILVYTFYAADAASMVSTTVLTLVLVAAGLAPLSDFAYVWMTSWVGQCVGIQIFGGALLVWLKIPYRLASRQSAFAVAMLLFLLIASAVAMAMVQTSFVVVALMMLYGYQFGLHAAGLASCLITVVGAVLTAIGIGPFSSVAVPPAMMLLGGFLNVVTGSVMHLTAAREDSQRAEAEMAAANRTLEQRVQDRTLALQDALEEAAAANRAKSLFIARAAHEFRTPLGAIIGYSDLLAEDVFGPLSDEQRDTVRRVFEAAQRMRRLVNDTIDLSRIEVGSVRLEYTSVDPRRFIDEVTAELGSLAQIKGLRLSAQALPGLPDVVRTDVQRLQQIAVNLVGNALKFTQRGEVRLEAGPADGERWMLRVADTGIGIPEDALKDIFQSFRKVERSIDIPIEGSGLGLAISRQLATVMGGEIRVQSAVGQGSTFTVLLPFDPPAPAAENEATPDESRPRPSDPRPQP